MEIISLQEFSEKNKKLDALYIQVSTILDELRKKEIPEEIVDFINQRIEEINSSNFMSKELVKLIRRNRNAILKLIEKDLKIVPRNHYRGTWMVLGMSVFGVPLGVAFGAGIGNMGFLGIGIPIGMVIGMAVGAGMDKKAAEEGRQLDIEVA